MSDLDGLLRGESDEVDLALEEVRRQLESLEAAPRNRAKEKLFLAALSSISWIGGFLAAAADAKFEDRDARADSLRTQWLEGHRRKLELLREALDELVARLDGFGEMIDERIQSEEYLALVRKAFRVWDAADTDEKRKYAATLVTNAAATRVCSDDVVRLFIDWLDRYHEVHFAVIQYVYHHDGCSRLDVWTSIYGRVPRDDSAEADLFKRLIRDLTIDGVIRQEREVTVAGQYLRQPSRGGRRPAPQVMETPFENTKGYELTSLGRQFVHYTMDQVVKRIEQPTSG